MAMNDFLFLACVLIGWMFIATTLLLCGCIFSSQLSQQESESEAGVWLEESNHQQQSATSYREVHQLNFLEPMGVGLSIAPIYTLFEFEAE